MFARRLTRLLLPLALAVAAHAQTGTPTLIAKVTSAGGTSSSINTTGANFAAICTHFGVTPTDNMNNTWTSALQETGYYDGSGCSWYVAFALKTSTAHTFTVPGYGFVAMTFNHVASGPDQTFQAVGNSGNPNTVTLGPVTPTKANELFLSGLDASIAPTTPLNATMSNATIVGTGQTVGAAYNHGWTAGYYVAGGTIASYSNTITSAQDNGTASSLVSFYSDLSPAPLTITNTSLPSDMRTQVYPTTCITPKGGVAPYTITQTAGTLPPGLTFSGGCISGTPTTSGTYGGLIFQVTDNASVTASSASLSILITPKVTKVDMHHPAYGWVLMPKSVRQFGVYETNPGPTGRLNYTIPQGAGFATLSCTTNCVGTVTVTITAAAGNCSISGTVGSYSVTGGTDFSVVATSVDQNEDGTYSTDTAPIHVCKGDHLVDVQPSYNQAWRGQQKVIYSYVLGQEPQGVTWSCLAPDSSNCNAALSDTTNRDVVFTAPANGPTGRYKITASNASDYDGTIASNYAWIYVGATAAPPACTNPTNGGTVALPKTQEGTEATACFADPAFGSRSYTVKKSGTGTYTHIWQLPIVDQTFPTTGYIGQVFNEDATGTAPTQYQDWVIERTGGTRDVPVVICGVVDQTACHNPIIQENGASGNPAGDPFDGTGNPGAVILLGKFPGGNPSDYEHSAGPDNVNLMGLDLADSSSTTDNKVIGVWAQSGRHTHLEGMSFDHMTNGFMVLSNTSYLAPRHTEFASIIGSHFTNCGTSGGSASGYHCAYMQDEYPLAVGNWFQGVIPGSDGAFIKERGGESIEAFNTFNGPAGYASMWWGDMTDDAPYTNTEMLLGTPGDAVCTDSPYCNWSTSGGGTAYLDWRHIMQNEKALSHDYFYGNIFNNNHGALGFSYSAQNTDGCTALYSTALCTMGEDHQGGFMLWNNTFDRFVDMGQSNDVFYNNGYGRTGVYGWPRLTYQNNSFWTDQPGYRIDLSAQFNADFKTNMLATGTVDITSPIRTTNTGWSTQIGGTGTGTPNPIWQGYDPKDSYLTGVNATNFLFTPTLPYSTTTYQPIANSPLNGSGTAITNALMAGLPVRWEPDPVKGFMLPRTDSGLTIGARSSATPVVARPTFSPTGGTYTSTQTVSIATTTPGATIYYTLDGSTPTTASSVYTAPLTVAVTTTINAMATASGYANSSVATATYTIQAAQQVATPVFSPVGGTYNAVQSVTITTSTPSASIYYTTDGSTPSTSSTVYSGPVSVGATETLKAYATAFGYTDSAVATAAYTINLPPLAPSFSPTPGNYTTAQTVTITPGTAGSSMYYTLDGTTPTASSTAYTVPLTIASTKTLKAIAIKVGQSSPVTTGLYTITPLPSTGLKFSGSFTLTCGNGVCTIK